MGANPDELEEADSAPPSPGTNKVEITVGGHTIVVESGDPLADVTGYALGLFQQTSDPAKQIRFGFDVTGGQFERAEPYVEPGQQSWEDEDARGMGRYQRNYAQDGTTRRLGVEDTPGGHRTRLLPLPVDREQRPLP